LSILKPECYY